MKIIIANKFKDFDTWADPEVLRDMRGYESKANDHYEEYEAEANGVDIPDVTTDEEAESMLADGFVQTEETFGEPLGDFGDIGRSQEGLPGEPSVEEEPVIKKREDVEGADEVDESVAAETEIDERVDEPGTAREAVQAAMDEHRVLEIFYVTKGRGGRNEKYYLKRERGLQREDGGGVNIHRIVEPHYVYTAGNGNEIVITYDRSVRRIRSFVINNIYDYNFTKNRRTKKDQYFKPRNRVMPVAAASEKGIKTMKNINGTLVKIASTLDSKGLKKSSEIVKNAEKALSTFKMAQYVGVQGYWIRNRRCWDNCYRQKRTSKPGTPAQEVWMECWDEYREAINNPKSTWAKYAEKNDILKISKKEEQTWNKIFADKVEDKMKEGLSRPEAVYTIIEAESQAYAIKVIKASSDLMTLADILVSGGHEEVGKQMAEMSMEMLKEAEIGGQQQNFIGRGVDKVKNFFGGFRGKGSSPDVRKKIENVISRAYGLLKMLSGSNVREAQAIGFIIEAGKGTRIVEAVGETGTRWGPVDISKADDPKSKSKQQMLDQFAPKGKNPKGDDDNDGVTNDQDVDDNANNIPDDQESNSTPDNFDNSNAYSQGDEKNPEGDDDGDNVKNKDDVDDDGNNVADDQETQEKTPSFRESYTSLMDDVSALTTELSGLQSAKDPQVSQWAKGAVPLLHSFVADSSVINQTPKGDRTQAIKQIVIQLTKGLQGVLAGQAPTGQVGDIPQQLDGQQLGNQQLGDQQLGDQNTGGATMSEMAQVASKSKDAQAVFQSLSSGNMNDGVMKLMLDYFESNSVPFTFANYTQFRNEFVTVMSSQAVAV